MYKLQLDSRNHPVESPCLCGFLPLQFSVAGLLPVQQAEMLYTDVREVAGVGTEVRTALSIAVYRCTELDLMCSQDLPIGMLHHATFSSSNTTELLEITCAVNNIF